MPYEMWDEYAIGSANSYEQSYSHIYSADIP